MVKKGRRPALLWVVIGWLACAGLVAAQSGQNAPQTFVVASVIGGDKTVASCEAARQQAEALRNSFWRPGGWSLPLQYDPATARKYYELAKRDRWFLSGGRKAELGVEDTRQFLLTNFIPQFEYFRAHTSDMDTANWPFYLCMARAELALLDRTAGSAPSAPRPASPPPPVPSAPPPAPASATLKAREPEGAAAGAALDEILDGAIPVAGQPATPPKPVKPKPVPPSLEVLTNTGTRCMKLKLENFRVDEYGNASQDWVLTNGCPTWQMVVAEVSSTGSPTMFSVPGIIWQGPGPFPLWNHKDLPPNLGFRPEFWNIWHYIVGPGEALRGSDIAHSGERFVAWLASCEAYKDGYFEMMFRAGPYLGVDPRVACVHNMPGAPR